MKLSLCTVVLIVGIMVALTTSSPVRAAAADGVRCPNGYETQFDSAQKTMRCERSTILHRPTVCDPATPSFLVYRTSRGRDFCVRAEDAALPLTVLGENDSRRRPVICSGDSADGSRWQIEIDSTGERDRCRAVRSEWIYPSQQ